MKTIGVFDSGIGGLSVAKAIEKAFPNYKIEYRADTKNVPYGTKTPEQIHGFIKPIFDELANFCDVIVIACNTVTTTLIDTLRVEYSVPIIGIEPMVKPASQLTGSKIIAVCATPTTLASKRYADLKNQFAQNITVLEPDCADWSELIEQSEMTEAKIRDDIEPALAAGADVIVLGCTHYHWIEQEIIEIVGQKATVLQPEFAIISRLKTILNQLKD